ncbi:MAG: DUF2177 family protein [Coriobacteriia bacterium]|nr:DUF2177 family protein [Coriobacteriia bacterium]
MVKLVELYLISTVTFFAIDFVWLSTMTSRFYQTHLDDLLLEKPNLPIAAAFYLLYVIGVLVLAALPAHEKGQVAVAIWRGAVFGLLAYGTYDLTNLSTLKGWSWQVSVVDMIWGAVITGTVATVAYYAARWLDV